MKPLACITISRTRWHGYVEAMIRHLEVQPRIVEWIKASKDAYLNLDPLKDYILDAYEKKEVQALVYVLVHMRTFDSSAQFTTQATGVQYLRLLSTVF